MKGVWDVSGRSDNLSTSMHQTPSAADRSHAQPEGMRGVAAMPAAAASSREIVFVDTAAPDVDALVDVLGQTCEVVVVSETGDGLSQMMEALSTRHDMDAIHVFAHGSADDFCLGSTAMGDEMLARFGRRLQADGHGLSARGRLLLYRLFRRT